MKAIVPYLKPRMKKISLGFIIKFLGASMDLMIPLILSYLLDHVVLTKDVKKIYLWGGAMIVCALIAVLTNICANRIAAAVSRDTTRELRHDLFCKISELSSRQIDEFTIPSLESRLTSDTYNINQIMNIMQRMGIRAPILLIGGIGLTLMLEPVLASMMILVLPIIVVTAVLIARKGIPMYTNLQEGVDHLVRTVRENISGIRVIKALSRTEQQKGDFAAVNKDVVKRETKAVVTMGMMQPLMNFFLNFGMVLVILVGAYRINAGKASPGTIIAFLSYFTIILNAMLSLTRIFVMYSRASASAKRIEEVLQTPSDLQVVAAPKVEEEEQIVFEDVSFSYEGKAENLSHISFKLKKGETLGIIGETGSGKTTIINLLMRMYEKDSGSIRIGGREVSSISPEELHTMFGVVFQNDVLFADTIYENIRFGRNISREKIEQAVSCAQAEEFIKDLPEGLEHPVTARGTNLSGGQKQRVLLARALAGDSPILVLDDSSSALDYKTDAKLRKALSEEYAHVTTLIVAQRVSSILHADHILVLEDGKAIGYGTHEELLKNCSVYREISQSQLGVNFE